MMEHTSFMQPSMSLVNDSLDAGLNDESSSQIHLEVAQLRRHLQQVQTDYQNEQDTVLQLKRKLNGFDKERLESTSHANEQISILQSESARLRAQSEKGEAARQNLEYDLAKCRRGLSHGKRESTQVKIEMNEVNQSLKYKLDDLSYKFEDLQHDAEKQLRDFEDEVKKLKNDLQEKESLLSVSAAGYEAVIVDKKHLELTLEDQHRLMTDLKERLNHLEADQRNQAEDWRRTQTDLECSKDRYERVGKDLQTAQARVCSLEESIEAERAAHLETKFNSEVIQLRLRDVETSLDVERSAQRQMSQALDEATKINRELDLFLQKERTVAADVKEKLTSLEKEHKTTNACLSCEVEDKKNVIKNLSKQLASHQKNFNDLKEDLVKARKRQVQLEETYGGSMKELDVLTKNFSIDDINVFPSKKTKSQKSTVKSPSGSLESLRRILIQYRKRLDVSTEELKKSKGQVECLNKESDTYKEKLQGKEKSLQANEKKLCRTAEDLNKSRRDYTELEAVIGRLRQDLNAQGQDKGRISDLSQEIMKLVRKHNADSEEKLLFMNSLCSHLMTARVSVTSGQAPGDQMSPAIAQMCTWSDACTKVMDEVTLMQKFLLHYKKQTDALHEATQKRDEQHCHLQHEQQLKLEQLSSLSTEKEHLWVNQRQQIEAHYSQLLDDLKHKSQKSQSVAAQAWEKVRVTGSVQEGLESQCSHLQQSLTQSQRDNEALLIACSLLSGSYWPLFLRYRQVVAERNHLEDNLLTLQEFKSRVQSLVSVLGSELSQVLPPTAEISDPPKKAKCSGLLRFRSAAVAVIAANRLRQYKKLGYYGSKMFVATGVAPDYQSLIVCRGRLQKMSDNEKDAPEHEMSDFDWLRSADLLAAVLSSVTDIQDIIGQSNTRGVYVDMNALTNASKASFSRLMDRLGLFFNCTSAMSDPMPGLKEHQSLIKHLEAGLLNAIQGTVLEDNGSIASSHDIYVALQKHVISMTKKMQSVEVEKCNAVEELGRESDELDACREQLIELEQEISDLKSNRAADGATVSVHQYDSVCEELNHALSREKQAQVLLYEQNQRMDELSSQINAQASHDVHRDSRLEQTTQNLSDAKMETRYKEHSLRQMDKKLSQLEKEKVSLKEKLKDAEHALRTAARDKDQLAAYMHAVEGALNKVRSRLSLCPAQDDSSGPGGECRSPELLSKSELIPAESGKPGPELKACQTLVSAFVDTQNQAVSKVRLLQEEVSAHKQHINRLKSELTVALSREQAYQSQLAGPVVDRALSRMASDESLLQEFKPLKEDSEISLSPTKSLTSVKRGGDKSPTHRLSGYVTPVRSSWSYGERPKVTGAGTSS